MENSELLRTLQNQIEFDETSNGYSGSSLDLIIRIPRLTLIPLNI